MREERIDGENEEAAGEEENRQGGDQEVGEEGGEKTRIEDDSPKTRAQEDGQEAVYSTGDDCSQEESRGNVRSGETGTSHEEDRRRRGAQEDVVV